MTVTGVYGAWSHIKVGTATFWVVSQYLTIDGTSGDGAPAVTGCAVPANVASASGTAVVTASSLNARSAPTTDCSTGMVSITKGQKYSRTGTYGEWWRLNIGGKAMWAHSDYLALEAAPAPAAALTRAGVGDLNGDKTSDVLAVRNDGRPCLYPGDGKGRWRASSTPVPSWGSARLVPLGDFSGDGRPDVAAVRSDGSLWLYRGNGTGGFASPVRIGTGWGSFTALIGGIDFDGDGHTDLIARSRTGYLTLYRGNGKSGWVSERRPVIGNGWAPFTALFTATDFDGDRRPDLIARKSDGTLWLYRMSGSGSWSGARKIGTGWGAFTSVFSPGDFNGDGSSDVLARKRNGELWLYRGNGSGGWSGWSVVGTGWNGMVQIH
ncbi:FG-GAP repeat domain-containing protein [Microbacterium elymi]|uniref:VCBS repeat-containing protein n=1 Tax=Microbacterium elymi TaxID=2909587 RepID=A0ABY5NKS0_9MICO|nr:VCBS repeat-containing protein [Microbacterium elymi]UUT35753.1 VCBS repeat-containing protein [Microbacterium elymi]